MQFIFDILGRMRGLKRRSLMLSSYPGLTEFDIAYCRRFIYTEQTF